MRYLIKKILREDFEWTNQANAFELGSFEEDDVSFDDSDAKVYLGVDGHVTYNLTIEELIEYAYDGYDDWVLETLVYSNGDYDEYYGDGYMDDDEINYLGGYLSEVQKERFQKILNHYNVDIKVEDTIDDSFSVFEKPMGKIYTGRWDWDDFTSESMGSLDAAITRNRWATAGDTYIKTLQDNKADVVCYDRNDVKVTIPFPYKGGNMLDLALSNIGLDDLSWSDVFYEDWDPSGAEEEIRHHFSMMLDKLEEQIDEEINS